MADAPLLAAIQDAADWLEARGVRADIPAWKRRDPREPGRREKEQAEHRLELFFARLFRRQAKAAQEKLQTVTQAAPLAEPMPTKYTDAEFMEWQSLAATDDEVAELIRILVSAATGGTEIAAQSSLIGIDYTLTNKEAAEWAQRYAYELIGAKRDKNGNITLGNIDATTLETLRSTIGDFVRTPGMTIGDVMGRLPFDQRRAQNIAVTEITRAYANGQRIVGEELAAEFPGVRVVKRWYTNEDDRVCLLCAPLDGKEVAIDEPFYEPEDQYQDGNPPRHIGCRCFQSVTTEIE